MDSRTESSLVRTPPHTLKDISKYRGVQDLEPSHTLETSRSPSITQTQGQGVRTITTSGTIKTCPDYHELKPSPPERTEHQAYTKHVKIEHQEQDISQATLVQKIVTQEVYGDTTTMYIMHDSRYNHRRYYTEPPTSKYDRDEKGVSDGVALDVTLQSAAPPMVCTPSAASYNEAEESYFIQPQTYKVCDEETTENVHIKAEPSLTKYAQHFNHSAVINHPTLTIHSEPSSEYPYNNKPHIQNNYASRPEYVSLMPGHQQSTALNHQTTNEIQQYNMYPSAQQWTMEDSYNPALWRCGTGHDLLNTCGLYNRTNGVSRPPVRTQQNIVPNQTGIQIQRVSCANCGINRTSMWRRNNRGESVCNACGLYFTLRGVNRPLTMNNEGIQRRKRKPKITNSLEMPIPKRQDAQSGKLIYGFLETKQLACDDPMLDTKFLNQSPYINEHTPPTSLDSPRPSVIISPSFQSINRN